VAGLVAGTGQSFAATLGLVESEVTVKTSDGTCDAALIRPASGAYPDVIIWPDAAGLRPSMREMAKRLAVEGYSVPGEARLVRARHAGRGWGADLRQSAGRARMEQAGRAVQDARVSA
jgi:hypothetical protein